ncbi:hypothetical protein HO173_010816 [Letharia columbiana]|uniref:Uncharacterized protein n=1 Tax=Letharia columbiana TaxID=112416 RepID=A0A8H6L0F8_9LECA|nr:uncharacterized protein HO173_010816 [Letharia columbiana]KAF6230908.1 hypothetical protein HO173_010816 [Letharia columbiana]
MHPYIAAPATLGLVYRAYSRKSLTPFGIVVAALTAVVHAIHPWSIFFALLVVFFLAGTAATKVKYDVKARLTLSSTGASGGEGARTHIQVLANSVVASILILLHYRQLNTRGKHDASGGECWAYGSDLLVVGIVSNYAAVAADTFSSELGILSKSKPRLLTSWNFRQVPPGTNGGVTLAGTLAGFVGAFIIALTSVILIPFCSADTTIRGKFLGNKPGFEGGDGWGWQEKIFWVIAVTIWGGLGSVLDSALGGWFQASVVDGRTGKVIEGSGGKKVLVSGSRTPANKKSDEPSRRIESGLGLLDNNAVNVLMAFLMSIGGMLISSYVWHVSLRSILS